MEILSRCCFVNHVHIDPYHQLASLWGAEHHIAPDKTTLLGSEGKKHLTADLPLLALSRGIRPPLSPRLRGE